MLLTPAWPLAGVLFCTFLLQVAGHISDRLSKLNVTLEGRLKSAEPLAAVCFSQPEGADCTALKEELLSNGFRQKLYPGFQNIQGEACMADPVNQCLLDPATLAPPPNSSCHQGLVSPLYVEIASAKDVQSIFKYARQTGTTLSIKNTGHDYLMRSSKQYSLAIWTRNLRGLKFHESFMPEGCSSNRAPTPAMTLGAGVSMEEAMSFAHDHGVIFVAGNSPTVGASGGWLLNGGHSPISVGLGLAVDRVLQFQLVTPDGKVRIANRCRNPDLFWALRGGGGGAFGVVLESTHIAEPDTPVTSAIFSFVGTTSVRRGWVGLLAEHMRDWALEGWGGPSATSLSVLVNPYLNESQARTMLAPAAEYVQSNGGVAIFQSYPSWFDFWATAANASYAGSAKVSSGLVLSSKIIPETVFLDQKARALMVDAIMTLEEAGLNPAFLATTPIRYGRSHPQANTSLHPAWYRSVWHVSGTAEWEYSSSLAHRQETILGLHNVTELLDSLTKGGCTYSNEDNPWRPNWAWEYWGDNYPRLLNVKKSVDPHNLLSCWRCVGWNDSLPGYGCASKLSQ